MEENYDSALDTLTHIENVCSLMDGLVNDLSMRRFRHDASKLESPEKEVFDEVTPRLKGLTYGSDEYKLSLADMGPALNHHYQNNRHHPEHFENGINGMTLVDLVEMICDWKAATLRHTDGDIVRSLEVNKERFGISDQLETILMNTVKEYFTE